MTGRKNRVPTEEFRRRYESGESTIQIAKATGYSHGAVQQRLRKAGVSMRPIGVPRRPEATYTAYHHRVAAARGRPKQCNRCGMDDPQRRYEWANLTGDYGDPADYERLCKPCHAKFDDIAGKVSRARQAKS